MNGASLLLMTRIKLARSYNLINTTLVTADYFWHNLLEVPGDSMRELENFRLMRGGLGDCLAVYSFTRRHWGAASRRLLHSIRGRDTKRKLKPP